MPTNPAQSEDAGTRHAQEDGGGEDVDQGRGAAAVQVTHVVAEVWGNGEEVGDLWGGRALGCGFEAEVAGFGVDTPVLDICISMLYYLSRIEKFEKGKVGERTGSPSGLSSSSPMRKVYS